MVEKINVDISEILNSQYIPFFSHFPALTVYSTLHMVQIGNPLSSNPHSRQLGSSRAREQSAVHKERKSHKR